MNELQKELEFRKFCLSCKWNQHVRYKYKRYPEWDSVWRACGRYTRREEQKFQLFKNHFCTEYKKAKK